MNIDTSKWHVGIGKVFTAVDNAFEYFITREGDEVAIASDIIDPTTEQPSKEYAEFILRACKEHAALAAQVGAMRAALRNSYSVLCDAYDELCEYNSQSDAARKASREIGSLRITLKDTPEAARAREQKRDALRAVEGE